MSKTQDNGSRPQWVIRWRRGEKVEAGISWNPSKEAAVEEVMAQVRTTTVQQVEFIDVTPVA